MNERELIAATQHEIWVHWMKYLFSVSAKNSDGSVTIPTEKVSRWKRQMATSYEHLLPEEKISDLEQADKVLKVFQGAPEYL